MTDKSFKKKMIAILCDRRMDIHIGKTWFREFQHHFQPIESIFVAMGTPHINPFLDHLKISEKYSQFDIRHKWITYD